MTSYCQSVQNIWAKATVALTCRAVKPVCRQMPAVQLHSAHTTVIF